MNEVVFHSLKVSPQGPDTNYLQKEAGHLSLACSGANYADGGAKEARNGGEKGGVNRTEPREAKGRGEVGKRG